MKLFFLIFLPFLSLAQASTYEPGDSTWITSSDTGKVKVYKIKDDSTWLKVWTSFKTTPIDTFRAACIYGRLIIDTFINHGECGWYLLPQPSPKISISGKDLLEAAIFKEEGLPNYRAISDIKEAESVYDVFTNPLQALESPIHCLISNDKPKYDTIGPFWKQVSDITPGYNPVMAMQLYEVRVYRNEWITVDPNALSMDATGQVVGSTLMATYREQTLIPHHFAWLDIKKKPFKLFVWNDKILAP